MLLLTMALFSNNFLGAQSCSPLYFEVCKILPDANSFPPIPNNPGPFHGYYKVKLKSTQGILPPAWNVSYLAFSGKINVNGFTSRINVDLTNLLSQTNSGGSNPYFQYLSFTEDGQVDWTVGSVYPCNQGEPGIVLPIQNGVTEIELFTIVVDGVPGDVVTFSGDNPNVDWVGDIIDCNYYYCSGTIPVLGCTNPANFIIPFPWPPNCNPQKTVTFELDTIPGGTRVIQVKLNNLVPSQIVRKSDMVIRIQPLMNGINNLVLKAIQANGGPEIAFSDTNGTTDFYIQLKAFSVLTTSANILTILIDGQFNLSQGANLECSMLPGRGVFADIPQTICSLTGVTNTLTIPGFAACPSAINVSPTRHTDPGCSLGVKYTIRHNEPNPINLTYLRLLFAFKLTNGNNSPGSPTTTLPCPSCGSLTYNATAKTWEYLYEQNTALSLQQTSEILVPFNINIDCISYYVILAEATPTGGSTCAMGVTFDINQWPACDPSVKGSIVVDKGGAAALAPLYKVNLESTSDTIYTIEDCKADYSFCPNPLNAPFQIRLESSSPNNYLCGVTTYDLVLISKHIMGTAPITEPKTLIAADAFLPTFGASSVTPQDIVSIRRCILGIDSIFGLTSAPSWWYFRDGYTFNTPNPLNPPYAGQTPLPKQALLFTLQFELKDKLELPSGPLFWTSEDILQNLIYQEDGSEFPIRLNWEEGRQDHSPMLGLIVSPNPFQERMTAFVYVEKPVKANISLTDGKGFIYSQQTVELQSGDNAVEVQTSTSTQSGVYFLSIEAEGQKIQRRVVKI